MSVTHPPQVLVIGAGIADDGRVLEVAADDVGGLGADATVARPAAYAAADMIDFARQSAPPRHRAQGGPAGMTEQPVPLAAVEPAADAEAAADVEAQIEEFDVDGPLVGIVMGSGSDMETMKAAETELSERGIRSEVRVMSAHREPDKVADYARNARLNGLRVIIAGAGLSAALPGVVAAHTELPVIGVPLTSRTSVAGGLDALLSVSQMPPGVPVACVGLDNARNAAILAARILAA